MLDSGIGNDSVWVALHDPGWNVPVDFPLNRLRPAGIAVNILTSDGRSMQATAVHHVTIYREGNSYELRISIDPNRVSNIDQLVRDAGAACDSTQRRKTGFAVTVEATVDDTVLGAWHFPAQAIPQIPGRPFTFTN